MKTHFVITRGDKTLVIALFLREDIILFCILKLNISHNHVININILAAFSFTFMPFYYYGIFQAIFNFGLKSLEKF